MRLIVSFLFISLFNIGQAQVVDDMPEFPGGGQALYEYLSKNLITPHEIKSISGFDGISKVSFVIDSIGKVTNVSVEKSACEVCDSAAVKVIRDMPNWKPGRVNGKNTSVDYKIPVRFKVAGVPSQNGTDKSRLGINQPDEESQKMIDSGDYEEALKRLKVLYRGEPNNHNYHLQMGQAKLGLGKTKSACASFNKAIELGSEEAKKYLEDNCSE